MARKSKTKEKVKEIIATALDEAANSTYCCECANAYMNPETMTGYCKIKAFFLMPRPIDAFDSCEDWEINKK